MKSSGKETDEGSPMKRLYRFTPELLLLVYLVLFIWLKHPSREWDRVINSDGKGYYAYLTGIFIYHDLEYRFVESYEEKYYPKDRSSFKEFRMDANGRTINKCFPGVAVAWLPFFLSAHAVSHIAGLETDGYSLLYQFAIALAALFYFWAGCRLLYRLLAGKGGSEVRAALITAVIALGTNMAYYTLIEGSMSHIISFFFITAFLYAVFRFSGEEEGKWFLAACFMLGMVILIRPVNALVILLVPAFLREPSGLPSFSSRLKKSFQTAGGIRVFFGLFLFFGILFLFPLLNWVQTGKLMVYSYGSETFDFANPRFFSILFSFNRGWFVYTPVAFVSLLGFFGLYRQNKTGFFAFLLFFLLLIYGASCWWMWYYASKCGQRIFVDFYAPVAVLLSSLFISLRGRPLLKHGLVSLLILLTGINLVQFYQHVKWIFPPVYITRGIYLDAVFTFHPVARVYIPGTAIISNRTLFHDMEQNRSWMNEGTATDTIAFSGRKASVIAPDRPFGIGLEAGLDSVFSGPNRVIRVTALVYSTGGRAGASLVADFRFNDTSRSYNAFYLHGYARSDRWTEINCGFHVPAYLPTGSSVRLYFYDPPDSRRLLIDDMKVEFLTLEDRPEYRKIEGVVLPVPSSQ